MKRLLILTLCAAAAGCSGPTNPKVEWLKEAKCPFDGKACELTDVRSDSYQQECTFVCPEGCTLHYETERGKWRLADAHKDRKKEWWERRWEKAAEGAEGQD